MVSLTTTPEAFKETIGRTSNKHSRGKGQMGKSTLKLELLTSQILWKR
jgi:hypothetical protein